VTLYILAVCDKFAVYVVVYTSDGSHERAELNALIFCLSLFTQMQFVCGFHVSNECVAYLKLMCRILNKLYRDTDSNCHEKQPSCLSSNSKYSEWFKYT